MNIKTLLKLEIKNRFSNYSLNSAKSYFKLFTTLVLLAAVVYGVYWVAELFFEMFDKAGIIYEALVMLVSAVFIFMCVAGVSSNIKVLYYKGDNEILMRYPVSGEEVFISKTLFLFINQLLVTAVIVAPFLTAYAKVSGLGVAFYATIPVPIVFLVLITFFLSNILAIPIMQITNKIRNKFALIIIGLAVLVTVLFAVYMVLFNSMVTFMNDKEFSVFDDAIVEGIGKVCKYLIPMKYFADIMVGEELYIAYPVLIMLTGITLIGTILVIVKLYPKTLLNNVEVEGSAFRHVTRNRRRPIFFTLLHKEFLQVFRSVNYSFQYFVLACAMPVMVYFCNNITIQLGQNQIGEQIALGMSLLVMLIFATVITSFAATSTSREGDNFYHTKVAPVSVHTQLAAKFLMYVIVSALANGVCAIVLFSTKQFDLNTSLWLFAVAESCSIALTLISMRMDINRPYFNLSGEGEVVNNNASTTLSVAAGFAVALVEGILCMLLSSLADIKLAFVLENGYIVEFTAQLMFYVCSGIAAALLIASIFGYLFRLKHAYNKIAK